MKHEEQKKAHDWRNRLLALNQIGVLSSPFLMLSIKYRLVSKWMSRETKSFSNCCRLLQEKVAEKNKM